MPDKYRRTLEGEMPKRRASRSSPKARNRTRHSCAGIGDWPKALLVFPIRPEKGTGTELGSVWRRAPSRRRGICPRLVAGTVDNAACLVAWPVSNDGFVLPMVPVFRR